MVQVHLWGSLKAAVGGVDHVDVEAANIRQLLTRLSEDYPGLAPVIEEGVSVSIDGELHQDAWLVPIAPENEIFVLPRMEGG